MDLTSETVSVWFTFVDEIVDEALLARYRKLLPPDELERYQKFRFGNAKKRYLVGRLLLRTVLADYLDLKPESIAFSRGPHGRPYLQGPAAREDVVFSLSYTDGLVAVALCSGISLGLDVECMDSKIEVLDIAQRYFSADEHRELLKLPGPRRNTRFFEMWTLKEAYLKARGLGLNLPLDEINFAATDGAEENLITCFTLTHDNNSWYFWLLNPDNTHKAAVCATKKTSMPPRLLCKKKIPLLAEEDFLLPPELP